MNTVKEHQHDPKRLFLRPLPQSDDCIVAFSSRRDDPFESHRSGRIRLQGDTMTACCFWALLALLFVGLTVVFTFKSLVRVLNGSRRQSP